MRATFRHAVLSIIVIPLLAACGEKVMEPAPPEALSRPTLTLSATPNRVLVPQSALVERGGIPGVFVLTGGDHARFRMVRTGKLINGQVEILSGLSGSETLVTGDLREIRDGSPIQAPRTEQAQQPAGQGK